MYNSRNTDIESLSKPLVRFHLKLPFCRVIQFYDLSKVFRLNCVFSTVRIITLQILCIMGNWICIIKQILLSYKVRKCFLLCCKAVIWFAGHIRPDHCSAAPNVWQCQTTDSTTVNVPTPHDQPRVGRGHSLLPQRSRSVGTARRIRGGHQTSWMPAVRAFRGTQVILDRKHRLSRRRLVWRWTWKRGLHIFHTCVPLRLGLRDRRQRQTLRGTQGRKCLGMWHPRRASSQLSLGREKEIIIYIFLIRHDCKYNEQNILMCFVKLKVQTKN